LNHGPILGCISSSEGEAETVKAYKCHTTTLKWGYESSLSFSVGSSIIDGRHPMSGPNSYWQEKNEKKGAGSEIAPIVYMWLQVL